jgi:hypothetical protein
MAKFLPDNTIDTELDYIALSDYLVACSGSPVTFSAVWGANMLAKTALVGGDFTKAADVSGRKITVGAKTGVTITNTGFCEAVALVNAAGSSLRLVTTATGQTLTASGTVDFPSFKFNAQQAT